MKILYLILTTRHQTNRQENQLKTWLKGQDYIFVSDVNGEKTIEFSTNDTYTSNEEKQINSINYVAKNYLRSDYDWFAFVDDDTFIFTENLEHALQDCNPLKVYGHLFTKDVDPDNPIFNKLSKDFRYCSGGAGYFISKKLMEQLPYIVNHNMGFGDVSFGINMKDRGFEFGHLSGCHPNHFKHYDRIHLKPISYHYVKSLEDMVYLYQIKGTYNVVSMSLWGSKPKYLVGALENVKLAKTYYPGWKLRFYIDKSIDIEFAKRLHGEGCQVYQTPGGLGSFEGMFWRFWVNDDYKVGKFCIRDADSRFNAREQAAVNDWITSNQPFHIMRDHKNHEFPIQGGLWGGTTGHIHNIKQMIVDWNMYDRYSCDQFFLANRIYPIVKDKSKVHCTYIEKKLFPSHDPIPEGYFVGQVFDENNKGFPE